MSARAERDPELKAFQVRRNKRMSGNKECDVMIEELVLAPMVGAESCIRAYKRIIQM